MSSTYAEFIRVEDIIKNVDKTTGGIVDKSAGLVLDEVEENSFKQIALTWDELPVTTVEDQTGARAARNSKSGMVKLVLNFCVAQELLVESQDRYYPTDKRKQGSRLRTETGFNIRSEQTGDRTGYCFDSRGRL